MTVFSILKGMFTTQQMLTGISSAAQHSSNIGLIQKAEGIQQKQVEDALKPLLGGANNAGENALAQSSGSLLKGSAAAGQGSALNVLG